MIIVVSTSDQDPSRPPAPIANGIVDTTGNTPLIRLTHLPVRSDIKVYAKYEATNPGGSAKDRTAQAMVEAARAAGRLKPGAQLVESSSGNLGIALARQALIAGYRFHCVVDGRTNATTIAHIQALGGTIHRVTQPDPRTGDWLIARRAEVARLVRTIPGAINLDQYSNRAAFHAHCQGTMAEIVRDLGTAPNHVMVAVSTTGTLGGIDMYRQQHGTHTRITAVDAAGSVLFGGQRDTRLLPGYGAGVEPELSREVHPDAVARIKDLDAVAGARLMAAREGILPGASGGAVTAAFKKAEGSFAPRDAVVMILHDAGMAYLDTVYNDAWVKQRLGVSRGELNHHMEAL